MVITGRVALLAFLATGVAALTVRSLGGILVVNAAILAVAAVDAAVAGSPRALRLSRRGDRAARLGEQADVTVVLRNEGRRTVRGVVRDAWVPSAGAAATRHDLHLAPGQATTVTTTLSPTRRGDRSPDRITVRSIGPLGLGGRQSWQVVPWRVTVRPRFASRKHLPSRLARLREIDGRTAVNVRGQGTEFDSLREYVIGDDVRSIDWRATARAADVVVRTWRPERDRRVVIVLDTGRTSAARIGDGTRLDTAMDAALLLGALASRAGDRVDLIAFDRRSRADVRGLTYGDVLPGITTAMTYLEPELLETDGRGLVAAVLSRVRQRALVVVLTALEPAAMEEGLLPALPALCARHLVIVAAVGDPAVAQQAAGRGDVPAVHAAAAAAASLRERQGLVERLTWMGVEVVDALPDDLAPALADRYLALKAAGRL